MSGLLGILFIVVVAAVLFMSVAMWLWYSPANIDVIGWLLNRYWYRNGPGAKQ